MLGKLLLAAMDEAGLDVELTASDPRLWQSFGILPRPAFFLLTSIRAPKAEAPSPRAQAGPRLGLSGATALHGRVLGPGDQPLARARVEIPSLDRTTFTDDDGAFAFATVPEASAARELRIRAAGLEHTVTLDLPAPPGETVLVRFDPAPDEP